jgi:catechol 2,3-dioxygenase-like lactoylglutathione lyase family enzyme
VEKVRVIIERVFHDWPGQLIVYEDFVPSGEEVPIPSDDVVSQASSRKPSRKKSARMKTRFRAITIACTDPARTATFYETVFGAVRRPADNGIGNWFQLGGVDITLLANATEKSPGKFPTHAMPILWLEVDDLAAAARLIADHGVPVIDEGDGQFMMIADPDGLVIEVWERESP